MFVVPESETPKRMKKKKEEQNRFYFLFFFTKNEAKIAAGDWLIVTKYRNYYVSGQ